MKHGIKPFGTSFGGEYVSKINLLCWRIQRYAWSCGIFLYLSNPLTSLGEQAGASEQLLNTSLYAVQCDSAEPPESGHVLQARDRERGLTKYYPVDHCPRQMGLVANRYIFMHSYIGGPCGRTIAIGGLDLQTEETWKATIPRGDPVMIDGPPSPIAMDIVCLQNDNIGILILGGYGSRLDCPSRTEWQVYDVSSGELRAMLCPSIPTVNHNGLGLSYYYAVAIPNTSLILTHYYFISFADDAKSKSLDAMFTVNTLSGDLVWSRILPNEHNADPRSIKVTPKRAEYVQIGMNSFCINSLVGDTKECYTVDEHADGTWGIRQADEIQEQIDLFLHEFKTRLGKECSSF